MNPLSKLALAEVGIGSLRERLLKLVEEAISQNALARIVWIAYDAAYEVVKATRGKVAVIVDDAFQVIGVKESAMYVKALLNLIEYPPEPYERLIAVVATSEGISRREIGRHRWATLLTMWNMTKEGFEELYEQLPGEKPPFEEVWRATGGNPKTLAELYQSSWKIDEAIRSVASGRMTTKSFVAKWRRWLEKAVEDPDVLWEPDAPEELVDELVERNLVLYFLPDRDARLWVDKSPPERDLELGIGKYVAWQTPIHREAIRRMMRIASS